MALTFWPNRFPPVSRYCQLSCLSIQYAQACREEGELREAKRTLEKLVARSQGSSDRYVEQAERELDKVRQKLGEAKDDGSQPLPDWAKRKGAR